MLLLPPPCDLIIPALAATPIDKLLDLNFILPSGNGANERTLAALASRSSLDAKSETLRYSFGRRVESGDGVGGLVVIKTVLEDLTGIRHESNRIEAEQGRGETKTGLYDEFS